MTVYSNTHHLLLKQLGIAPLAARTELFAPLAVGSNAVDNQSAAEIALESRYQSIPASHFADDVNIILSQSSLSSWQIDIHASQCQITEQTLITPPLPLLQQASQKRQLWQLLAGYLND